MARVCKTCGVEKPLTEYYKQSNRKSYYTWCKECHKEVNRKGTLKQYGLTPEEFNQMFADQKGECLICKRHQSEFKETLSVDHDHKTGKVRGLLCGACNRAIGLFKDDPNIIRAAIDYLKDNR